LCYEGNRRFRFHPPAFFKILNLIDLNRWHADCLRPFPQAAADATASPFKPKAAEGIEIDGDHALTAVRETRGWAANASDRSMRSFSKLIREKEGLQVLPASTAGLIALAEHLRLDPFGNDRYVVVLAGRRG
jgi:threonine synthase